MSPVIGFTHPTTGETLSLAEAPARLDADGVMPKEALQAMLADITGPKHKGPHLSPSIMNPDTTCRRQIVGERYLDYIENPMRLWAALEGTFFHNTMAGAGSTLEVNQRLPGYGTDVQMYKTVFEHEPSGLRVRREDPDPNLTEYEIEMWPGVYLSGEADRIAGGEIIDHKTSRYSKTDYGERNVAEWAIQLNLYRHMYEAMTGRKVTSLFVWRTYRGCYEADKVFRKFPVPLLSKDTLYAKIGVWAESLRDMLLTAEKIKSEGGDLKAFVATIPMDGHDKQMFGNQKCPKYCGLYEICFGLAGKVAF